MRIGAGRLCGFLREGRNVCFKGMRQEGVQEFFRTYRNDFAKAINLVVIVAVLAWFSSFAARAVAHDEAVAAQILEAERAASRGAYPNDGVFTGAAQGYGGLVRMQVTIEGGYIDAVEIVDASSEDEAWLDMASVLPERIVAAQSTDIDVVSGATYTSAGILNGATEALRQSMEGAGS